MDDNEGWTVVERKQRRPAGRRVERQELVAPVILARVQGMVRMLMNGNELSCEMPSRRQSALLAQEEWTHMLGTFRFYGTIIAIYEWQGTSEEALRVAREKGLNWLHARSVTECKNKGAALDALQRWAAREWYSVPPPLLPFLGVVN